MEEDGTMNIGEYLKEKKLRIFFLICIYTAAGLFLSATGVLLPVICLVETVFLLAGIVILLWDFTKRMRYYEDLSNTIRMLEKSSFLMETTQMPLFWDGRIVSAMFDEIRKSFNDQIAEQTRANREYRQYIESWVHEIKLPIAAARMIVSNHPGPKTESIGEELSKIEDYVQQALYYARSESVEKDYYISPLSLKELVLKELAAHSGKMIQAGIRPVVEIPDYRILADSKWCSFILRQILSNSIKYKRDANARICFTAQEDGAHIWLHIADNGIGISSRDLNRVFDKGFTGENGRKYGASTGMGLYLCKKLCEKMEMEIRVASIQGQETRVSIRFTKD